MSEDNKELNEIQSITPYQRLQNLFDEGKEPVLTEKANKNIDDILGLKENKTPSFWDKIKSFFNKIDGYIFSKQTKVTNRYQRRG